jgi:hypothetical protein
VSEDRLRDVWAEAQAQRAPDVGWEPDDWAPVLRARRRGDLLVLVALVLGTVTSLVVRLVVRDRPLAVETWFWLVAVLVYVAVMVRAHATSAGRSEWLEETRRDVRVDHALRHHVSIGAADRAAVSKRAEELDRNAGVAVVGYPLLALVAVATLAELDFPTVPKVVATAAAVAVCGLLLTRSLRRGRWGTRWLADPLPRDEGLAWS